MTRQSCVACCYSEVEADATSAGMVCHRYPPQLVPFAFGIARAQPSISETDWCAEFVPNRIARTPVELGPRDRLRLAWSTLRGTA